MYTARDPCHVTPYIMYSYMCECITGSSKFVQCSDSVRVFSASVEVLSSELGVSHSIFSLIRRYLLLKRRVVVSEQPWKQMLLQKWLVTRATATVGRKSATPPSLTKTGQWLGGMLQRTATWVRYSTVLAKVHKFNRIMLTEHKSYKFNDT